MERFEKLKALSPLAAVQAWMEGDFGLGDEPAIHFAIRKDPRIQLSNDAIEHLIFKAMEDGLTAQACLDRLAEGN